MDVNGVGTASITGLTLTQHTTEKSELYSASRSSEVERPKHHERHGHGHRHGHGGRHGLNALRQEIRLLLSTSFHINVSKSVAAYSENAGNQLPGDVAAETLGAVKEIAARSPLQAGDTLVDVREKIDDAANDVRDSLGEEAKEDVDGAIDLVNKGLDDLEEDAARNVVSSATVLSAETQTRQRSTIRIRTQEGDLIRLSLRNVERMSAEDVSISDGDSTFTSTDIQLSSRSRMVLRVKGDLNEAEMTAIKSVFEQAEAIAGEFFGGDLGAAFEMAAGLEYDTEQLSRINMRFRERQTSNVAYAAIGTSQPGVVEEPGPIIAGPTEPVVESVEPVAVPGPVSTSEAPEVVPEVTPEVSLPLEDAIDGFFNLLASFLSSLNEGFESDSESGSFRFFHSQSFNLQILKTVFQVSAPEDSGDAAEAAATLVDTVSE